MKTVWFRRHPLGTALLLSLLVHLAMLWDGDLAALTEMLEPDDPDQVLERKKAKAVPKVKLAIKPAARPAGAPGRPQVTLTFEEPPKPPAAPKTAPAPKPAPTVAAKPKAVAPAPASAVTDTASAITAPPPAAAPAEAPIPAAVPVADATPPAPPAPKYEPPPAFPSELQARYRASVEGIKVDVQQVWRMEGYQYSIENISSFVGIKFRMSSEGEISPERGLIPADYRLLMNKKVLRFASFNHGTHMVRYGKPDNEKVALMEDVIYDPLSLGYQLAIGFTGEPFELRFTTGTRVSSARLALVGEELLKLPGGELRTLHIQGQSLEGTPFEVDVWLAPDHRNFPAKVRIVRKGDALDLSLKSLAFEGEQRFGKKLKAKDDEEETVVPNEWLERPDFKDYRPAEPVKGLPGEDTP